MNLILLGGGGHAASCISCLESGGHKVVGFLDRPDTTPRSFWGYELLGVDDDLPRMLDRCDGFLITVGQIGLSPKRKALFDRVVQAGGALPSIVSVSAFCDARATLGAGTILFRNTVVNLGTKIGENTIVNTGAVVEHDCVIGNHVHISTGAIVNGGCSIGDGSFVGSGAVLRNNISVVADVLLGAGTVVVQDIIEPGVYVGNPARKIR